MKTKGFLIHGLWVIPVILGTGFCVIAQTPAGSAFTYQGLLRLNGLPVADTCDFTFTLYDADAPGGNPVPIGGTSTIARLNVPVEDGVFTVDLDWGANVFDGNERWLEITQVNCPNAGAAPGPMTPRTKLNPTPYSVTALQQGGACCDDLSSLFDKAFLQAVTLTDNDDAEVFVTPAGQTRYVTGIWVQGIGGSQSVLGVCVSMPGANTCGNVTNPFVMQLALNDGRNATWSSAGGAPIRVPAGNGLDITSVFSSGGGTHRVTILGYQFP